MPLPSVVPADQADKLVSIYALIDPRDQTPFYVGVTSKKPKVRLSSHLNDACYLEMKGGRYDIIRAIALSGHRAEIVELETVKLCNWVEGEQFWIEYLRFLGARLTNIGTGGPGGFGAKQTKETQLRRQASAKGRDMSPLHSPEIRERVATSLRHKIEIDGVVYSGIKAAAREIGVSYGALHYRLDVGLAKRITPRKNNNERKRKGGLPCGAKHWRSRPVTIDCKVYCSRTAVAVAFGVSQSVVGTWLVNGRAQYIDGGPPLLRRKGKPLKGRPSGKKHYRSRPVIVDGKLYWGIVGAYKAIGLSRATINRWLKTGRAQYA